MKEKAKGNTHTLIDTIKVASSESSFPSEHQTQLMSDNTDAIEDPLQVFGSEKFTEEDMEMIELQEYFYAASYGGFKIHGFPIIVRSLTVR